MNEIFCRVTGKKRFPTRIRATHCIRSLKIHSRRQYIPKRAYHCRHCGGWHLTSKDDAYQPNAGKSK